MQIFGRWWRLGAALHGFTHEAHAQLGMTLARQGQQRIICGRENQSGNLAALRRAAQQCLHVRLRQRFEMRLSLRFLARGSPPRSSGATREVIAHSAARLLMHAERTTADTAIHWHRRSIGSLHDDSQSANGAGPTHRSINVGLDPQHVARFVALPHRCAVYAVAATLPCHCFHPATAASSGLQRETNDVYFRVSYTPNGAIGYKQITLLQLVTF